MVHHHGASLVHDLRQTVGWERKSPGTPPWGVRGIWRLKEGLPPGSQDSLQEQVLV